MNPVLAQPWGLLALLSLPLIVWLHRHVVQAERREVSSLMLWLDHEDVRREGRVKQRIRERLVLFLELLAATLLSLLLAGFDLRAPSSTHARVGLVVDASASMAGGTHAKSAGIATHPLDRTREALAELSQSDPELRITLIAAGDQPVLLGDRDLRAADADAQLARLSPAAPLARIDRAESLLGSLGLPPESTLIFSDDPELDPPASASRVSRVVRVGKPEGNFAIVNAGWARGERPFIAVRRLGPAPKRLRVRISQGDTRSTSEHELDFSQSDEQPLELDVAEGTERIDVMLPDDALAADNHATLLPPLERRVRVQLGSVPEAVKTALTRAARAIDLLELSEDPDSELHVVHGTVPGTPAAAIGAASGATRTFATLAFASSTAESRMALELHADPFSPLTRDLNLRGLVICTYPLSAPPDAKVLVRTPDRPVLWQRGTELVLNVDVACSNLLTHSAFPMLMDALARELDAARGGLRQTSWKQGERIVFRPAVSWKEGGLVRTPSGRILRFTLPGSGQARSAQGKSPLAPIDLGVAEETGLYSLEVRATVPTVPTVPTLQRFVVHFAHESESDLSQRKEPTRVLPKLVPTSLPSDEPSSLVRTLLLLCVLACVSAAFAWLLRQGQRT